ncbi:uncharacterized protein LOC125229325 [Leguminivora glycinivorella]|uniref:uncharacterized protein LOC125229325 n=1 Tax=Leguminivora glycinivorella TaxID=1035111 RepID=UPI00201039B3|nr:uncharacterized protein LOC125229325 [Leguminivora glycinivorella]
MFLERVFVFLMCLWVCQGREFVDKMDRYLIACHTTDFTCFKRQYTALRDNVILGNVKLAIDDFEPYSVQYGQDCVNIEGWTESELIGIGMDSNKKELIMALVLPVYFKQVKNDIHCSKPQQEFTNIDQYAHNGTLMDFTGNATVSVIFPFTLLKKKGEVYLKLEEEEVDALVDIPVYVSEGGVEDADAKELNQASDWAFNIVQHIKAAEDFALPFTSRIRTAFQRIPFRRLMLLYPEEDYSDLQFAFIDPIVL